MQFVDQRMGGGLGPRGQMQHRDDLGQWIEGQPELERMRPVTEPGTQFVKLDVWEVEGTKDAVVQGQTVRAGPRQPGGDGGVPMPKHPHSGSDREPFGQGCQHVGNPVRGGFETVQGRHPEGTRDAC
jgi:hypothetical protein